MNNTKDQAAFILRIAPSEIDKVPEALRENQIIIGWAKAQGLLSPNLDWLQFREIIHKAYYSTEATHRKAGAGGGHMWRFIRDMKPNDLVVVPYGSEFYVAEITGAATYVPAKAHDDSSYRRPVKWLNNKKSIPREIARSALISRMKIQGTSATATDLLNEIKECLSLAEEGKVPAFQGDLQMRLVREVLAELRGGRMDSYKFEHLIKGVLLGLGAEEAQVVARSKDNGADIVAKFRVAGTFLQIIAVQAKHWQPEPPVGRDVVEQLIRGMETEEATLGMVVTSGSIGDDASKAAEQFFLEKGLRIELVDGEQFAKLIVENGIGRTE